MRCFCNHFVKTFISKMRLVVLIPLFACAVSAAVPGQERCVWGPTYWCSSVSHAKVCGAEQHCLTTVWKYQIVKVESTTTCTYCQLIVTEMKSALADKTTQDEIADVLAKVCTILPSDDVKSICKGIVTEDLPILIQMLENDVSVDMVCSALGLCSGLKDTWSPYGEKQGTSDVSIVGNSTCQDCMKFFKDVQDSVTSKETQDELQQLLNQTLCSQLGAFGEECNDLVKQYLPVLLQALADQIDPDIICRIFGFCTSSGNNQLDVIHIKNVFKNKGPLQYRSSEECDICKELVQQLDDVLKDKTTQDKVKAVLEDEVCTALGSLAGECKQLVEEYAPMLFELLENELDPTTLCETLGLCTVRSRPQIVPAMLVEPASMVGAGYVKKSAECEVCEFIMQEVDNLLKENQTIVELEDWIDKVCTRLTTPDLESKCKDFVQEYGDMVLTLLAQELDPKTVCTALSLCTASQSIVVKPKADDTVCELCVMVVQELETVLADIPQQTMLDYFDKFCADLPANLSLTCEKYVKQYGPLIISLLKSKEDPKSLCTLLQACQAKEPKPYMTKPIPETLPAGQVKATVPSEECEVCDTIIIFLKNALQQNATKEEIEHEVETLCSYLPSEFTSTCQQFVETYGDKVVELLLKHLKAHEICIELGLCKEGSISVLTPYLGALKEENPKNQLSSILSPLNTLPIQPVVDDTKAVKETVPSEACKVCDTVIFMVKNMLQPNASKEAVKEALEDVCSILPEYSEQCETFVKEYDDEVIHLLLQALDPHAICTLLGLCKEGSVAKLAPSFNDPKADSAVTCEVCTLVLGFLDNELQQNKTEENIKAALEDLCDKLPTSVHSECTSLVEEYTHVIINYIVLGLTPKQICDALTLCSANTPVRTLPKPVHVKLLKNTNVNLTPVDAGPECVICEFVLKELDDLLKGNKSAEAIQEALDKVCAYLPSTISTECADFVDKYSKVIINLIVADLDPAEVCTALKLCTADVVAPLATKVHILKEKLNTKGSDLCVLCKEVVTEIKKYLKENKTTEEIDELLKKFCKALPDTVSAQCDEVIDMYVPAIMDLLTEDLDPEQVCKAVGACSKTSVSVGTNKDKDTLFFQPHKQHLLGGKECTYGPSFWCASQENAIRCQAVEHCTNHVWN